MNLLALYKLAKNSSYNEQGKAKFRKEAVAQFKAFAENLGLKPETYEVRFNPGGIAVSGDITLHHEKFYINLNESGCYWRTVKGLKDYVGGPNNWLIHMTGADNSLDFRKKLVKLLAS